MSVDKDPSPAHPSNVFRQPGHRDSPRRRRAGSGVQLSHHSGSAPNGSRRGGRHSPQPSETAEGGGRPTPRGQGPSRLFSRAVVWLRQDLRLADNPALHAAALVADTGECLEAPCSP